MATTAASRVWEGDMMTDLATVLGGLGVGGIGGGVVTGLFARRRNRADALATLEGVATRLAERADARVTEVERQLAEHKHLDAERVARRRLAAARHQRWDNEVAASLRSLGVEVQTPPPLDAE